MLSLENEEQHHPDLTMLSLSVTFAAFAFAFASFAAKLPDPDPVPWDWRVPVGWTQVLLPGGGCRQFA